jgi:hypothetical protein
MSYSHLLVKVALEQEATEDKWPVRKLQPGERGTGLRAPKGGWKKQDKSVTADEIRKAKEMFSNYHQTGKLVRPE